MYNHEQNISRLFHVLAKFLFPTSESKVGYYHQNVNIGAVSQVSQRLLDLLSLEIWKYQENSWKAWN